MRRFATWVAVLMLIAVGALAPRSMHAQPATPEKTCALEGATVESLDQIPTGNNDEILELISFNFNAPTVISVKDCQASEIYHVDDGSIIFNFSPVQPGTVLRASGKVCSGPGAKPIPSPSAGGQTPQCELTTGQDYTAQAGDSVGHTGPAGYTLAAGVAIQGGAEEASSGLDQGSGDPRGTRGCNGRC